MPPPTDEPVETVSFRIPKSVKETVEQAAQLRHETATSIFRAALEEYLSPQRRRVHEIPGFTKRFDDFLDGLTKGRGMQAALFVVEGRDGRYVYDGIFDPNSTNSSLVAVKSGDNTYVLPRASVVAWEGGDAPTVNRLAMALRRSGYTMVTAARAHG